LARSFSEIKVSFSNTNMTLLLQLVYSGSDIFSLLERGFEYSQVAKLIEEAVEKGYLTERDEKLLLTNSGIERMRKNEKGVKRKDGGWISPYELYKKQKMSLSEIYLPSSNDKLFKARQDR